MKNLNLTALLIVTTLIFTSCTVDEDLTLQDETSGKLFEKLIVKRDLNGAYYLDMQLNEGTDVDIVDDHKSNSKELNFYSSDENMRRNLNESFTTGSKGRFNLAVKNTLDDRRSTITVVDDDIRYDRSTEDDHLTDYSFTDNNDGTYDLEFTVDENIETDFVYNEDTKTYEIHLETGEDNEREFFRTFTKEEDENLEIVFVNHFYDRSERNYSTLIRKPEIIIGND